MYNKKLILAIAILLTSAFSLPAQQKLNINGVPVCSDRNAFVQTLRGNQYRVFPPDDKGDVTLVGPYEGITGCAITVSSDNGGNVSLVEIKTPPALKWEDTAALYRNLKASLKKDYGEPYAIKESLPDSADTDYKKKQAIISEEGTFESVFKADDGFATLRIARLKKNSINVIILYKPEENL